jgi:hypothetical protein
MTPTPKKEFFRSFFVQEFFRGAVFSTGVKSNQIHRGQAIDSAKDARAKTTRVGRRELAPTMCSRAAGSVWPPGDRMPTGRSQ